MKSQKLGSWQPYIPKLGSAIGCRSGVRNEAEEFNIQHVSRKYQEVNEKVSKCPLPAAAECAFVGGSFTMKDLNAGELRSSLRFNHGTVSACVTSLGPNLVPTETGKSTDGRAHRGKSSMESSAELWKTDCLESDVRDPVKSRCNAETMKPLDNIGAGMGPRVDRFMDAVSKKKIIPGASERSSLGPGMIPIGSESDIKDSCPIVEATSSRSSKEYVRKYGINT